MGLLATRISEIWGKSPPHFGPAKGIRQPKKIYPAVKIHPGKFEDGALKNSPLAGRLGTLTQSASTETGHGQPGGLISASEEHGQVSVPHNPVIRERTEGGVPHLDSKNGQQSQQREMHV